MKMAVCNSKMSISTIAMAVVALISITQTVKGQTTPSCVANLVPCLNYLNISNPPSSCCDPLREAVTKELVCLCNLYDNPALLTQSRINVTQAIALPSHCGIPGEISDCNKATAPTPSSVPPVSPGVPGNDGNRVDGMAWTLMSCLLLLCASAKLY